MIRRLALATIVAVTAVLVWLAVRTIEFDRTWDALRQSEFVWALPSLALLALSVPLRALRWQVLFAPGRRPPFAATTASMLVGLFFNSILPLRAGEAARVLDLGRRTGTSRAETLATVGVERAVDVLALIALLVCSLPFLPDVGWARTAAWLGAALLLGLVAVAVALALFGDRPLHLLAVPLRWVPLGVERRERAVGHLGLGLAALRDWRVAALSGALTLVSWLVLAASCWALMPAFDLGLGYEAGVLVLVAVGLASVVPAPPASLGVFEGAVVVALTAFDVEPSIALSYALVLHAVNFFPYLLAGLAVLPGRGPR
ncbi:MAG: lysylphosphatidylglycerol synthase transmembrane domain-containing protein [Gaiellaceae bacterium]